jgi:hypothetical protein
MCVIIIKDVSLDNSKEFGLYDLISYAILKANEFIWIHKHMHQIAKST